MTTLNKQWQLTTFGAVLAAQLINSATSVDINIPEVQDLISRGYIMARPDLGSNGNNVVVEAVKSSTVTPANLVRDLGLATDDATIDAILAPLGYDSTYVPFPTAVAPAPVIAPVVQQEQVAVAQPAPVFHEQQVSLAQPAVQPAVQPQVAPATAPLPHVGEVAQTAPLGTAPAGAPVVQPLTDTSAHVPEIKPAYGANEAVTLGAGQAHAVLGATTVKDQTFEIEVGVPFSKKATGFTKGSAPKREWKPSLPFEDIAHALVSYGYGSAQIPSFHVAGSSTQSLSGAVRRASDEYTKRPVEGVPNDLITFRATNVDATDPKGEGVRVYAMWLSKAPAVKQRAPKAK